jgi:TRAP-type mannitol/chloroaromatic compound transport system permease small subunit
MGACGNAVVLPPMLVVSGVLWMLPLLLLVVVNCVPRQETDLPGMYGCVEKVFMLAVAFLVASEYSFGIVIIKRFVDILYKNLPLKVQQLTN